MQCILHTAFDNDLPQSAPPLVISKFNEFKLHKDEYEVLFIGNSRVYREISPKTFDAEMRVGGYQVKSYNFGLPAMKLFEAEYLIERLLALKPAKLKYIVFQPDLEQDATGRYEPTYAPNDPRHKTFTARAVYWHSFKQTLHALESYFETGRSLREKISKAFSHIEAFFIESLNRGKTVVALRRHFKKDERTPLPERAVETESGYRSLDSDAEIRQDVRGRREELIQDLTAFETEKDYVLVANDLRTLPGKSLLKVFDFIQNSGPKVLIYLPSDRSFDAGLRSKVFAHYPVLDLSNAHFTHDLGNYFDHAHLSAKGAVLNSKLIAQKFISILHSQTHFQVQGEHDAFY